MINFLYVREILKITSLAKIFYLSIQKLGKKKKVSQLTQSLVLSFAASLNTSRAALWRARRNLKKPVVYLQIRLQSPHVRRHIEIFTQKEQ